MQSALWKGLRAAARVGVRSSWAIAALLAASAVACTAASNPPSAASPSAASPSAAESPAAPSPAAETAPTAPAPTAQAPATTRSGQFVAAEHPTQGGVTLIEENGRRYLELDGNFQTDAGPDLFVVLHKASNILATTNPPAYPLAEGDYVELAPLQSTEGTQRYEIPDAIALADYSSVAIWCRQFNATFGAAALM